MARKNKNTKATKTIVIKHASVGITPNQYEGALKAKRAIKELDPTLSNPTMFSRYCHFDQIVQIFEAELTGNVIAD